MFGLFKKKQPQVVDLKIHDRVQVLIDNIYDFSMTSFDVDQMILTSSKDARVQIIVHRTYPGAYPYIGGFIVPVNALESSTLGQAIYANKMLACEFEHQNLFEKTDAILKEVY